MSDNFDPIGGILSDIAEALVNLILGLIVAPINAILNPIFGFDPIDLND